MNPETLTSLLNDATDTVEPSPGFADTVLRSGRRRQVRRRMTMAASAVIAVAMVVGGVYVTSYQDTEQVTAANPLLDQPTKGDLAGDQAFVDQAKELWRSQLTRHPDSVRQVFDDMRGDPHVYWAGNTPVGRAAVVVQQHYVHQNSQLHQNAEGLRTAAGLVAIDPADGKLKLVVVQWETDAPDIKTRIGQFQFGPGDRTILVVATGKPLFYSQGPQPRDGMLDHNWKAMPEKDGVAVVELSPDVDPVMARVVEQTKPAPADEAMERRLHLLTATEYLNWVAGAVSTQPNGPAGLRWPAPGLTAGSSGGPQFNVADTYFAEVTLKLSSGSAMDSYSSSWHVRAGLPDGRVAVLGDVQKGGAARFYALLVTPDMTYEVHEGGPVNVDEPLPVHFQLPDAQGWIVAQLNQPLKYRTSTNGDWQDVGMNAALVPDETVQVMVGTTVVDLPR